MKYEPRRHQIISENFLRSHARCALFLEMGLGKTSVALTVLKERIDDYAISCGLVIAPKNVAEDTWTREADKWDHLRSLRISKVVGTEKQRSQALLMPADLYVINRENVVWLTEQLGGRWPFGMTIIDELSSFKSSKSKRWRALRKVIGVSDYVVGLTGTPAGNGYLDLWPEMYLIDGGERLGRTLTSYRSHWFTPGASRGHVVFDWRLKPGAKAEIDGRLSDICVSMQAEDWITLPPVLVEDIWVRLDKPARALYDEMKREKILPVIEGKIGGDITDAEHAITADMAATLTGKLLQMANGAVYDDGGAVHQIHDAKLDALEELIEAAGDEPVLVFYSYKHDLDRIKSRFPDAEELKGSDTISRWNRGEIPLLLCHPASAGHGLNLQDGGHILIWFGLPWSLELYQQANARLERQGQTRSVRQYHILAENTLDAGVLEALTKKGATQKSLLDALKQYVRKESKNAESGANVQEVRTDAGSLIGEDHCHRFRRMPLPERVAGHRGPEPVGHPRSQARQGDGRGADPLDVPQRRGAARGGGLVSGAGAVVRRGQREPAENDRSLRQ